MFPAIPMTLMEQGAAAQHEFVLSCEDGRVLQVGGHADRLHVITANIMKDNGSG